MEDLFGDEEEVETQALEVLARQAIDDRRQADRDAKTAKKSKEAADESEARLWDALDQAKTKTTTLELGEGYGDVQVGKRSTVTATILNQEMLEEALKAEPGLAEQILAKTHTIRKKVLNQEIRNRQKAGRPLPDGADVHEKKYVQLTFK